MGKYDELASKPGVLTAGRFGADGHVAEYKDAELYFHVPGALEIAQAFCLAATATLTAMAAAMDRLSHGGVDTTSWLPMSSWQYTGGDYAIVVHGNEFLVTEPAKVKDRDELRQIMLKTP
jgi:roadblock/LC7 domain-containing protein